MRISDWSSDVCSSDLANFLRCLRNQLGLQDRCVAGIERLRQLTRGLFVQGTESSAGMRIHQRYGVSLAHLIDGIAHEPFQPECSQADVMLRQRLGINKRSGCRPRLTPDGRSEERRVGK